VTKSFETKLVIKEASFTLEARSVTLFTGSSGIGKSTLLEIMAGIQAPDTGIVKRSAPISFMFQDNALIPWLTAEANLSYILPKNSDPKKWAERIAALLDFFQLEKGDYPHTMSGGMRRRLSLARTFLLKRPIIILDEPFAFLDENWHHLVSSLIVEAYRDNAALVIAEHSLNPALKEALEEKITVCELQDSPIELRLE
jgi:ABC-type nitrate/sulfonate/bicarbonate transport system ATPase subunit